MQIKIKRTPKSYNDYTITMRGVMASNIITIQRALADYLSPAADDLLGALIKAISESKDTQLRNEYNA